MSYRTVQSEDGIDYRILETPGSLSIPYISWKFHDDIPDGYLLHHLYVRCEDLRALKLPLDANPREPTNSDVVKKMVNTLTDNPNRFHHWNNGISIIVNEIQESGDGLLNISFNQGDGICNGGHTYFSIETFPEEIDPSALVHLELIELPEMESMDRIKQIVDIATWRNRNKQLKESTQADYLGFYDPFKEMLVADSKFVIWHEGDGEAIRGEAISSEHFIRLVASLDPFWYSHPIINPRGADHSAAQGTKAIHTKWYDGVDEGDPTSNLYHMRFLLHNLFQIRDMISYSLLNDDFSSISPRWRRKAFYQWMNKGERDLHFYNPGERGNKVPDTAEVIITGLFRQSVWIGTDPDGNPRYVGWLVDPERLWNTTKYELLGDITSLFDDSGRDPIAFKRMKGPHEKQLIKIMYGMNPPDYPVVIYGISNGAIYHLDDHRPTHYLEYQSVPPMADLIETHDHEVPEGTRGYRI